MAIVRHEAGAIAPADGTYALVGHYGEATNFAIRCRKGERLPLAIVSEDLEPPLWFVQVGEETSVRLVA
jgi:hypothetical protein